MSFYEISQIKKGNELFGKRIGQWCEQRTDLSRVDHNVTIFNNLLMIAETAYDPGTEI